MSQTEMQNLLYAALAAGADQEAPHLHSETAAALANQCNIAAIDLAKQTPAEIIAHYDFRARTPRHVR
ncbi:MAG: hypothetical protein EXR11_11675 [Rhodospirillaceae bacterium]|nr:hypothetical protein [Rhodospirillaceae bacterium]